MEQALTIIFATKVCFNGDIKNNRWGSGHHHLQSTLRHLTNCVLALETCEQENSDMPVELLPDIICLLFCSFFG